MPGVDFLYYCSIKDVYERILLAQPVAQWETTAANADNPLLRRAIRLSYAQINAKAKKGGYDVPVTNSTKTLADGALTAAANAPKDITLDDVAGFSISDTVRIHNLTAATSLYSDEFVGIVKIASSVITVENLEYAYDDNATVELCTEGFLWLNSCNATGAAYLVLSGLTVGQGRSKNDKLEQYREDWLKCQEDLVDGTIDLDGLSVGQSFIKTYQSDNPNAVDVGPQITTEMRF